MTCTLYPFCMIIDCLTFHYQASERRGKCYRHYLCFINFFIFNLKPILTATFYSGFIWGMDFFHVLPFVIEGLVLLFLCSWFHQMWLQLVHICLLNWFQKELFCSLFQASDTKKKMSCKSNMKFRHVMPPKIYLKFWKEKKKSCKPCDDP